MCVIYIFFKKRFGKKKKLPVKVNYFVFKVPLFHINYQHITVYSNIATIM